MRLEFEAHGHHFRIQGSPWSGFERIHCDETVVSEKRSYYYVTPHIFSLSEGEEQATYELNVITSFLGFSLGYVLRRNGIAIACRP